MRYIQRVLLIFSA